MSSKRRERKQQGQGQEQKALANEQPSAQLASMTRRAALANMGLAQCDCGCDRVLKLEEALVTIYKGNVIQTLSLTCFGPKAYLIRRVEQGINIKVLDAEQAAQICGVPERSRIVQASSISDIRSVVNQVQKSGRAESK